MVKLRPEVWSIKEIVGHLIDSATNNHQRFVRLSRRRSLHSLATTKTPGCGCRVIKIVRGSS